MSLAIRRWCATDRRRAGLVLVAVCLVAGACDGRDDPGPAGATSPTAGASPSVEPIFGPDDDVLRVAIADPATLDPMRIQDPGSELVARQLYEGLTRWDPVTENVRPAAAQSWEVSDGGRTFTFTLRPGMSFHDGTAVTAQDFLFAFDRIALKANASDIAYTLERVDGFLEVNQLGRLAHLRGITAPDDLTLVIRLSEPYYDFPAVLTHPGLVPVPRAAVADIDTFTRFPTGNGPFRMVQPWEPGAPVIMRAFVGFIRTPELEGLMFVPYPDAAASWLQFLDGELEVAEVPADSLQLAERTFGDRGFQQSLHGYYFGFNLKSEAVDDVRLRRAVSRAIDRRRIAKNIYNGTMDLPRGIVPAGMPGFFENICLTLCSHNQDLARRLVSEIPRNARDITLEFSTGDGQPHARVAHAVREDLEAVGLDVRIRGYAFGKFLKKLRAGASGMYRQGWIAQYPVADEFLSPLFRSTSPDNYSGFGSDAVDQLLAEAHAEPSDGRRVQLYIEAEKMILRSVPMIPIGSFVTHWAAQQEVENIVFDATGGFDAARVSLAEG